MWRMDRVFLARRFSRRDSSDKVMEFSLIDEADVGVFLAAEV